jgi:hypothetical protein
MIATATAISADAVHALEFIAAIFDPDDNVEFRCINKVGHVRSFWSMADEVGPLMSELGELNQRKFNIYLGVNPRRELEKSGDDNVLLARCIFADFDDVGEGEAHQRIDAAKLPNPSIVNFSGYGVHCYWVLVEPITDMAIWKQFQKGLASILKSDSSVCNPERIMRLPGTINWKDS